MKPPEVASGEPAHDVVTAEVVVQGEQGLHLRPATEFARTALASGCTVRVLVGVLAFPTAWITAAVLTADGAARVTLLVITFAAGAVAAVWLVERAMALTQMLLRWQAQRERVGTVGWAEAVRAEVVATVRAVVGERP